MVLKVAYIYYVVVMEHIVVLIVDLGQNLVFVPLLATKLETLVPWAIANAPIHLISILAWEKLVVSD